MVVLVIAAAVYYGDVPVGARPASVTLPPDPMPLQKKVEPPPPNWSGGAFWGRVTDVTPTGITISGEGHKGLGPDFALKGELRFPMARHLLGPELRTGTNSPGEGYRPEHVCVGDHVTIRLSRIDGVIYCFTISIHRRPGGLVPPDPLEHLSGPIGRPYHERINTWNEERDRGPIPIAPAPRAVMPPTIPPAAP